MAEPVGFSVRTAGSSRIVVSATLASDAVLPVAHRRAQLRQPIYRQNLLSQREEAKSNVKGVDAQLDTDYPGDGRARRSAYFDALFARDSLDLIGSQKASYEAQLRAAKMALGAGTGTRTDIDDVQARYDLLLADEIRARQAITAATEQLEIFVGERITVLSTLDPASFRADAHDPEH